MSHEIFNSLTHLKHVVVPYWKTTGKVIIPVKNQLQSKLCTKDMLRYTAMGRTPHPGQNCYKSRTRDLIPVFLSAAQVGAALIYSRGSAISAVWEEYSPNMQDVWEKKGERTGSPCSPRTATERNAEVII